MPELSGNALVACQVIERIAQVKFNCLDERSYMSPTLNREMMTVLDMLDFS